MDITRGAGGVKGCVWMAQLCWCASQAAVSEDVRGVWWCVGRAQMRASTRTRRQLGTGAGYPG